MKKNIVLALALGPLIACSHYSQKDGEKLANDVYALSTQVQALQRSMNEAQKEQDKQAKQLSQISEQIASFSSTALKNGADLGSQLDNALQEVARMKGLLEPMRDRLDTVESKVNKVGEEIDVRVKDLEAKTNDKARAAVDSAERERLMSNPSALFDKVVKLLNDQKPADARKLLREFSVRAQNDKGGLGKQADTAQYLLAESYFLESNYQAAATEYNAVRKQWPKSPKIPESLLRLGQCFEKLNLPNDAKLFYKVLVTDHPKSEPARKAKELLKNLK
jgi:TolA-binding protein